MKRSPVNAKVLSEYARFLVVGVLMALLTIVAREVLALCLPAESPGYFALSIAVVYVVGIILNFKLQAKFVFPYGVTGGLPGRFVSFCISGLLGGVCAVLVSLGLRYGLELDRILGAWSPTLSFAIALVVSSVLTFQLNRAWVFSASR